jgi:DNA-binding NarL/FixJ family response regulator
MRLEINYDKHCFTVIFKEGVLYLPLIDFNFFFYESPMHPISIGFYDEKHLISSYIYSFFSQQPRVKIFFNARNEMTLYKELHRSLPEVLLMNLLTGIRLNFALLRQLKRDFPALRTVVFVYGIDLSQQEIFNIINAGATSILTDAHSAEDLFHTMESVMKHGFCMNNMVNEGMFSYCKKNQRLLSSFGAEEKFSNRAIHVIEEKRKGKTSQKIADQLCVSKKTVDGILQNLYDRFDCRNFHELLLRYENLKSESA